VGQPARGVDESHEHHDMTRAGWIRLGVVALCVAALEIACRLRWIDPVSVIPPSRMALGAWSLLASGEYTQDILLTLENVAMAFGIALVLGFAAGVLLHRLPRLRRAADPLLASYYAVPTFIFYPLFIVLFGLNRWPLVAIGVMFAVVAMALIDRLGRRPLLGFGLSGIALSMLLLAYGFGSATYTLDREAIAGLPASIDHQQLATLAGKTYDSDTAFREAVTHAVGHDAYQQFEPRLVSSAISMNPLLVLLAILGFVASFAVSIGPVMWVLFSELFPNRVRGRAISFVGLINSTIAFLVTLVFPWQLETLGNSTTFLIYGLFALIGLVFVMRILPETKGRSLEELETALVRN